MREGVGGVQLATDNEHRGVRSHLSDGGNAAAAALTNYRGHRVFVVFLSSCLDPGPLPPLYRSFPTHYFSHSPL